jgi:hypothetical protein
MKQYDLPPTESDHIRNNDDTRIGDNNINNKKKSKHRGSRKKPPTASRNRSFRDLYAMQRDTDHFTPKIISPSPISKIGLTRRSSSCTSESSQISYTSSTEGYIHNNCFPRLDEIANKSDFQYCYDKLKNKVGRQDIGIINCVDYHNDLITSKGKDNIANLNDLQHYVVEEFKKRVHPQETKSSRNHNSYGNDTLGDENGGSFTDYSETLEATGEESSQSTSLDCRYNRKIPLEIGDSSNVIISTPNDHGQDSNKSRLRTLIPLGNRARVDMVLKTPKQIKTKKPASPARGPMNLIDRVHSGLAKGNSKSSSGAPVSTRMVYKNAPMYQNKKSNEIKRSRSAIIGGLGVTSEKKTVHEDGILLDQIRNGSLMKSNGWSRGRSVTTVNHTMYDRSKKSTKTEKRRLQ